MNIQIQYLEVSRGTTLGNSVFKLLNILFCLQDVSYAFYTYMKNN